MSTSEPKSESKSESKSEPKPDSHKDEALASDEVPAAGESTSPAASDAKATPPSLDEPVWPPPEAKPREPAAAESPAAKSDEPQVLTKPDEPPAEKPSEPAAEPAQEMALSESTLHWLVDGEQPIEPSVPNPILMPAYDPKAPVVGRKRTIAVIGGAAIVALGIAWVLHAQAARHQTAPVAQTVGAADLLIRRAEAALAQGRSAEALDLARLAIVTDGRLANAYIVIGTVERANGQVNEARDSYRHYLEIAPLGMHAAEARDALTTLPP